MTRAKHGGIQKALECGDCKKWVRNPQGRNGRCTALLPKWVTDTAVPLFGEMVRNADASGCLVFTARFKREVPVRAHVREGRMVAAHARGER